MLAGDAATKGRGAAGAVESGAFGGGTGARGAVAYDVTGANGFAVGVEAVVENGLAGDVGVVNGFPAGAGVVGRASGEVTATLATGPRLSRLG